MKKWIFPLLLIALLFSLPYIASVPPFKQLVLRYVEKKIDARLKVNHLRLSWLGPQRAKGVTFQTTEFAGTFEEVDLHSPLWKVEKDFTLSGGKIEVEGSPTLLENVHIAVVNSNIEATGTNFSVRGTFVDKEDFSLTFDMTKMATAIVDWLLKSKGMVSAALGPNFDMQGSAILKSGSGKVDLTLTSPTAKATIVTAITPDAITFQKPLNVTLNISPEKSLQLTHGKIATTGEDPIVLTISPKNCLISRPFSLEKIKVCRGSLSLGRIRLQNAHYLSGLSIFLKTNKLDTRQVDAWLGRIDFSYENGRVDLARIDALLANSIHLCAWGETNILKQTLDMILGVPADTLSKSFSIRNVSSRYVLQVPMSGTYDNPQLDTTSATAKVAAIIAAGKVEKQGGILGGVASVINQAAQERSPPPVTPYPPFPWDR